MAEPAPSQVVNLVDERTGEVVNVDEKDLSKLGGGYRIATDEEVAKDLERQQYGEGFGNEAAAFGESALSGATLGLSDVAARAISPEYAAELAKRREYNPLAAGIGEGAGILGATLLSGGLGGAAAGAAEGGGLLARGGMALARGATAPVRGLVGLGEAATAGTARLLGAEAATSVLGQAARQAAAYGVGGGVEGALFGAAKAVTDDYLQDHEITAERIWAGAQEGGLVGGGLGAGLGFTGAVLGGAARKVRDMFSASEGERKAARVLDEALEADAATGASAEAGVSAQTLEADQRLMNQIGYKSDDQIAAELSTTPHPEMQSAIDKVKQYASNAEAAKRFDSDLSSTTQSMVDDVELVRRNADELNRYINRGQKRNAARDLAEAAPPQWSADSVSTVTNAVEETNNRLKAMREDAAALTPADHAAIKNAVDVGDELLARMRGFKGQADAGKRWKSAAEQFGPLAPDSPVMAAERGAATADDIADFFDMHDKYKTALGRAQNAAKRGNGGRVSTGAGAIQREYMGHRALLENEGLYGKGITEMQRITNAAESEAIRFGDAWDTIAGLAESKKTKAAGEFDFEKLNEADFDKVKGFIQRAGANPQDERTFVLGLQRQADLQKVKSDYYKMPPEARAKALESQKAAERVIARYREAKALKQAGEQYTQAVSELREVPFFGQQLANLKLTFGRSASVVSDVMGEAVARASGGAASARAGSAAGTALRAGIRGESSLQNAAKGVVNWLREAGKATGRGAQRAGRAAYQASKAGPLLGVSLSAENPATYERLIRNIGALQDPQSDERKMARARAFELRQQNPQLANALEAHTQKVGDFLVDKAGDMSVGPRPGDPFGHLREPRHAPAKYEKMARYVDAATNPRGALERISQGELVREDVEVLQTLYPRLYQRVRDEVLMNLSSVDELPSYDARLKLSILLGAPADPSMRPQMVQALQQVAQTGRNQQAQGGQEAAQAGPIGEPTLSPSARREPRTGKLYATQTDAQSVEGSRLGG